MYCKKLVVAFVLFMIGYAIPTYAQGPEVPKESVIQEPVTALWLNTYGVIRFSNRLFWDAQTHFRFQEKGSTPFAGQIAQVYNRHAIGYIFSKKFNFSLGGVLRVNFNTKGLENQKNAVPEWRIWHQYQFAMPLSKLMVYHRIRIEHRWTKGFDEDSDYIFRNRWRYMLRFKIPLNRPKLGPKTVYFSPEAELIMQSGKPVVDSPMEDLRLTGTLGYIINPRVSVAAGGMYSLGQELTEGELYKQKWTVRCHLYFSLDFRKVKHKLPSIHTND